MVNVAITPKSSTSKIYVVVTQTIQVWNSSAYATGRWRILRNIGGGSYAAVMEDLSTANGNIFAYDYGGSGINVYFPMTYQFLDTPNTTSQVIYKTQIAQGSNGGNRITSDGSNPARMTLHGDRTMSTIFADNFKNTSGGDPVNINEVKTDKLTGKTTAGSITSTR